MEDSLIRPINHKTWNSVLCVELFINIKTIQITRRNKGKYKFR